MSLPLTRYEQLIAEELAGIISSEDQAVLDKAKADHPEVYNLWQEKHAVFAEHSVRSWLDEESVPPAVSAVPVVGKYKRVRLAAAGLAALIIGGIFFLVPGGKKEPLAAKTGNAIELKLENGKIIDLSQEGKVQAGNISLSNQQKSLTYAASNAAGEMATLSVPAGKDYKITLSDGTEIFLNSASSLYFPISFNNSTREIRITGEAYLKVAKDPSRPFIVNMQESAVQVLGTEFNVNSYEKGNLQVALVEGKVQFKAGQDSTTLKPGFAATYKNNTSIQTERFDADDLLSWRKGIFLFNDKALEEVFKVIPRWFGQEVVIDNPKTGKEHFTGVFDRNKTIRQNLDVLKAYNGIDYSIDENNVIHIK